MVTTSVKNRNLLDILEIFHDEYMIWAMTEIALMSKRELFAKNSTFEIFFTNQNMLENKK